MSMKAPDYVCVLRWKPAELQALAHIGTDIAASFIPILEPTPRMVRRFADNPDAFRGALRKNAKALGLAWHGRHVMLDVSLIQKVDRSGSIHVLPYLMQQAIQYGLRPIPVVGLDDAREIVEEAIATAGDRAPVGLRVGINEVSTVFGRARLRSTLSNWGCGVSRVHLIIDQRMVTNDEPPLTEIVGVGSLGMWHAVTILGGSFPPDLIKLEPDVHRLPRLEARQYRRILAESSDGDLVPSFGDYGTQHAFFEEPHTPCFPSVSVRYSLPDEWLVLRGQSLRIEDAGGMEQFRGHALYLSAQPEFSGATYSEGDRFIAERTMDGSSPGSFMTWLAASLNHHVVLTARSVALMRARAPELRAQHRRRLGGDTDHQQPGIQHP